MVLTGQEIIQREKALAVRHFELCPLGVQLKHAAVQRLAVTTNRPTRSSAKVKRQGVNTCVIRKHHICQ